MNGTCQNNDFLACCENCTCGTTDVIPGLNVIIELLINELVC